MLRNAKSMFGYELRARDGRIGHVEDFYLDDQHWSVRYLVVDTGRWLSGRRVLISPVALGLPDWRERLLPVSLTMEQVRQSPGVETERTVSREDEIRLTEYYGWPAYWGVAGYLEGGFGMPIMPTEPAEIPNFQSARDPKENYLRSVRQLAGSAIEATDGAIGHVDDLILDDAQWEVRFIAIDTRNWWPGKKVLVAPMWISEIERRGAKILVALSRAAIKDSPAYNPSQPVTADYATQLNEHYGQPHHNAW